MNVTNNHVEFNHHHTVTYSTFTAANAFVGVFRAHRRVWWLKLSFSRTALITLLSKSLSWIGGARGLFAAGGEEMRKGRKEAERKGRKGTKGGTPLPEINFWLRPFF